MLLKWHLSNAKYDLVVSVRVDTKRWEYLSKCKLKIEGDVNMGGSEQDKLVKDKGKEGLFAIGGWLENKSLFDCFVIVTSRFKLSKSFLDIQVNLL